MKPHRMYPACVSLVALCAALCFSSADSHAQGCAPPACALSFHSVSFEGFAAGTSVEGLGAVDPDLALTSVPWSFSPSCAAGSAAVIEEGNPIPFSAYATNTNINNNCLNGTKGFADNSGCVLDYDFTFAPGVTVGCFGIRIVDYGDFFPFGGSIHQVLLTAYDVGNNVVNQDQLSVTGGVNLTGGDACSAQAGDPGNTVLSVSGPGIVKLTLRYNAYPDPNVGYDDITFCELSQPTPALRRSWGFVKTRYR